MDQAKLGHGPARRASKPLIGAGRSLSRGLVHARECRQGWLRLPWADMRALMLH